MELCNPENMQMAFDPINAANDELYHRYHLNRFKFLWKVMEAIPASNVLEIGPWTLTHNLRRCNINVDTMGFLAPTLFDAGGNNYHYEFNFRDKRNRDKWPTPVRQYDLVLACEVIEHLFIKPTTIFEFLAHYVRPGGHILIQTPNGVSLKRRMAVLAGKNPYDMVVSETEKDGDGHIREFTVPELVNLASLSGFEVKATYCKNYFDYSHSSKARIYKAVCDLLPSSFRDGVTLHITKSICRN